MTNEKHTKAIKDLVDYLNETYNQPDSWFDGLIEGKEGYREIEIEEYKENSFTSAAHRVAEETGLDPEFVILSILEHDDYNG